VAADFLELAEEKSLKLRVIRSGIIIRSDRHLLEEMIRNLLSNAIRYTDRGSILVGCRRADDKVRIEVWDTGAGIAAEHITQIFEEYYQGSESADYGGLGLGLAIVQRLGKLVGHPVNVRSVPGKGSGFSIEVPLADKSAIAEARSNASPHTSYAPLVGNILVIEDESSVRRALDSFLRSEGLSVQSVASGNEALTLVTKNGMRPDLVISDYNLPGNMNGVEIIEALRVALAWKIPGIVLTGDIRSQVTKSIATYGLAVAPKPFDADELLQLIKLRYVNSLHKSGRRSRRYRATEQWLVRGQCPLWVISRHFLMSAFSLNHVRFAPESGHS
jgi:CheY-like chemotaxis protein